MTPTISWGVPSDITYGTPLSSTQLDATASVSGRFTYSPAAGTVLSAGASQQLSVTFTPIDTDAYGTVTTSVSITVQRAAPTINWANPANIAYGTALGSTQLNASASVPGTFVYSPAAGTVLSAGSNQKLSVTFIPTDSTNYNAQTTSVQITVLRATPTITWPQPAGIPYGTALSSMQLDATADVPGIFAYTPPIGTVLNLGANQTLSVTFTPTDTINHNTQTASVLINVTPAQLQSITINAVKNSIAKGTTDQFTATGTFSDGSTQDLTHSVVWSSSNPTVSIDATGLATGSAIGSSNISAAQGGVTSNPLTLSVTPAVLKSISITAASNSLAK